MNFETYFKQGATLSKPEWRELKKALGAGIAKDVAEHLGMKIWDDVVETEKSKRAEKFQNLIRQPGVITNVYAQNKWSQDR